MRDSYGDAFMAAWAAWASRKTGGPLRRSRMDRLTCSTVSDWSTPRLRTGWGSWTSSACWCFRPFSDSASLRLSLAEFGVLAPGCSPESGARVTPDRPWWVSNRTAMPRARTSCDPWPWTSRRGFRRDMSRSGP